MTKLELSKKVIENIVVLEGLKKDISSLKNSCPEWYLSELDTNKIDISNMYSWEELGNKGEKFLFETFKKGYIESFRIRTMKEKAILQDIKIYLEAKINEFDFEDNNSCEDEEDSGIELEDLELEDFDVMEDLEEELEDHETDYETQISIPVNYSFSEWVELQNNKSLEEKQHREELINEESPF
jgi:hypothetical protein